MKTVEIICRNCGADTLLKREALYKGFNRIGEKLSCASCGFEYATEDDVPFKARNGSPVIFTEADRSAKVAVFEEHENARLCRYCTNYIINPFTQFCSLRRREVQATDSCPQFEKAQPKDSPGKTV